MRWSWTPSETGRRRCSSSFPIPMTPSISSWQSCIPSSSTFSATRQMTFTTDGFPFMYAVCWTSLRTSVKSRSLISSSPPSEAGKSRRQSSCSPSLSSRPSTRMRRIPLLVTVTAPCFWEENPIKVHPNIIYSTFCGSRMFLFSVSPLSRNL